MAGYKWDTVHRGNRCGHSWCTGCRTRRGWNRGNRRVRHVVRVLLTQQRKERPDGQD